MAIDPRIACLEKGGKKFQVLKPQTFADRPILDGDGQPTGRTEQVPLPREWDEAATFLALKNG